MSSPAPSVSLALLTAQPSFDSNTISLFLQIAFSAGGYYETGGIPGVGLLALASEMGINVNQYLQTLIQSEIAGAYTYKYIPSTDSIQIFQNGSELASSAGISTGILNDVIVAKATFNRL